LIALFLLNNYPYVNTWDHSGFEKHAILVLSNKLKNPLLQITSKVTRYLATLE